MISRKLKRCDILVMYAYASTLAIVFLFIISHYADIDVKFALTLSEVFNQSIQHFHVKPEENLSKKLKQGQIKHPLLSIYI